MVGYSSTVGFVSSVQAEKVTPVRDSACFITREHSSSPTAAGQVHPRAIHHTHRNWARVWMYIQWQTCVFERGTLISAVFFMRWGNVSLYCNVQMRWSHWRGFFGSTWFHKFSEWVITSVSLFYLVVFVCAGRCGSVLRWDECSLVFPLRISSAGFGPGGLSVRRWRESFY